jgi:DNA-binding GntR family transcriptional regulator
MEGRLVPGQRLKIHELAGAMGVSETPVREAVMQLVRERGLEMSTGRQITVAELTLAQYLELRKIRLLLEPLAAEAAVTRITGADIDRLAGIHGELVAAEAAGDWHTAVRANWLFHFGLFRLAEMPELLGILEGIWLRNGPLLNYLYPDAAPTYPGRHQHEILLDALRARDAAGVRGAMRADLIEGGSRLLALLEGIEAGRGPRDITGRRRAS